MLTTVDTFQQRVDSALSLLRASGYSDLADLITSVHETDDTFEAFTDGYKTYLGNPVAEWPEENKRDQIAILATYLGHEAVHIRLYKERDSNWNTDEGERQAMIVQQEIADKIGVPEIYVLCPLQAVPDRYLGMSGRLEFIPSTDVVKLGVLTAVAFAGMLIIKVRNKSGRNRARHRIRRRL